MLSPLGKPLFWATNFFSVVSPYSSTLRFKCGSTNCTDQCCGLLMWLTEEFRRVLMVVKVHINVVNALHQEYQGD
ncbi:hypothetical protein PVK06_007973 [Gossypium arboreum]|uniref:Uncharacterized protein n=1 Tax=Gossypium arboreum TaxID=29729 RepID=A0ABR0QIR4_GOSAR|nr:hypothetical protein PVK06_007973 [Gossypium arboreum]